jgi:hypothetical protein
MTYDRSFCAAIAHPFPFGERFLCSVRAAARLGITDKYVRVLAKAGKLHVYFNPATPKLLFFKVTDLLEYRQRKMSRGNRGR